MRRFLFNHSSPLIGVVGLLTFLVAVQGYGQFQMEIPNGEIVPHPCKPNYLWRGVGHRNHLGGGARNPFGLSFKEFGMKWTETLCRQDSDGDGKTNGEELGDPDCTWTKGAKPHTSLGLSHPGVCDPFDSPRCNGRPEFVDCEKLQFQCDAIENEGDRNFTVRLPETSVPAQVTTYMCVAFEFPSDVDAGYHIIATSPIIDNLDIMHHMLVLGCQGDVSDLVLGQSYQCGMSGYTQCIDLLGGWTVGTAGQCFANHAAGFLVGGTKGYIYAILQAHWTNPYLREDYTDSSGLTFHLTPRLRPHNAGMLVIGQSVLTIPPGRARHEEHGLCSGKCTSRTWLGNITVMQASNHMHYLGISQYTQLHRQDGGKVDLAIDETFQYESPTRHVHPEGITVSPGDEMTTMCVYKSTSRSTTTFQGEGTLDEMCFSFIIYFPQENLSNKLCISSRSLERCDILAGNVAGCNFTALRDPSNPKYAKVTAEVPELCTPGICRSECLEYVREVKKDPCYQGEVAELTRHLTHRSNPQGMVWYAAFDSCDVEMKGDTCTSSGVKWEPALLIYIVLLALAVASTCYC